MDLAQGSGFPTCDSPVWLFGRPYFVHHDLDELRRSVSTCIRMTYRKNFPRIGDTSLSSDSGWGCMIRVGQMVIAKALLLRHLGSDWHWASHTRDPKYLQLMGLFADTKTAPLSIHQIALTGASLGNSVGSKMGQTAVAQALKKLLASETTAMDLQMFVAPDTTLVKPEIKRGCLTSPVPSSVQPAGSALSQYSFNTSRNDPKWKPLLLVVPLRLGLLDLNPRYVPAIKAVFEIKQNIGIIGGKPNHALYYIGYAGDEVLFLDPNTVQSSVAVGSKDFDTEKLADESYHVEKPGRMHFAAMNSSIALCFYCNSEDDFDNLCAKLNERFLNMPLPLFQIRDKRRANWAVSSSYSVPCPASSKSPSHSNLSPSQEFTKSTSQHSYSAGSSLGKSDFDDEINEEPQIEEFDQNLDNLVFAMETGGNDTRRSIIRRLLATVPSEELRGLHKLIPRIRIKHLRRGDAEFEQKTKEKKGAKNKDRRDRRRQEKEQQKQLQVFKPQQQPATAEKQQQPEAAQQQPEAAQQQPEAAQQQPEAVPQTQHQSTSLSTTLKKGIFYKVKDRDSIIPDSAILGFMLLDKESDEIVVDSVEDEVGCAGEKKGDWEEDHMELESVADELGLRSAKKLDWEEDEMEGWGWGDEDGPSSSAGSGGPACDTGEILDRQAYPSDSGTVIRWWVRFGVNVVAIDVEFVEVLKQGLIEGVHVRYFNDFENRFYKGSSPRVGWERIGGGKGTGIFDCKAATISIIGWDLKPLCPKIFVRHAAGSYVNNSYTRKVNGIKWNELDNKKYKTLDQASADVKKLIEGKLIITHTGEKDFAAIGLRAADYAKNHFDISHEWHRQINGKSSKIDHLRIKLKDIYHHYFGSEIQTGVHCSDVDAIATMRIFKEVYINMKTDNVGEKFNEGHYDKDFQFFKAPVYVARNYSSEEEDDFS